MHQQTFMGYSDNQFRQVFCEDKYTVYKIPAKLILYGYAYLAESSIKADFMWHLKKSVKKFAEWSVKK